MCPKYYLINVGAVYIQVTNVPVSPLVENILL